MSDTPRTDAEVMYADCADSCLEVYVTRRADGKSHDGDIVSGDFARTLERELSAARAELAEYRKMHDGNLSRIAELSGKVDSLRLTLQDSMSVSRNLRAELATARGCLREMCEEVPIDTVWAMRHVEKWQRWRKAAGMDATAGEVKA